MCELSGEYNGFASGVIVSPDGIVLTTTDVVTGRSDNEVTVILSDRKQLKAKCLGRHHWGLQKRFVNCAMLKIISPEPLPFVEMGKAANLTKGDWCLALGHAGGYRPERGLVVRLGRILEIKERICSSCAIVGGDSGGPLFDFDGRVIGIHSSIGTSMNQNYHNSIDTYKESWERLLAQERLHRRSLALPSVSDGSV